MTSRTRAAAGALFAAALYLLPGVAWAGPAPGSPGGTGVPDRGRALVLRPARIDLMVNGQLLESVVRRTGPFGLAEVARLAHRPDWLRRLPDGDYRLAAAVVQKPGTTLVVESPDVRRLLLVTGSGARLLGSNARLSLDGVALVAWDWRGQRLAAPSGGRGFVHYSGGGQVVINRSQLRNLGTPGAGTSGMTAGGRTSVVLTDTRVDGGAVGLMLVQSGGARLTRVTVSGSAGDGAVLRQTQGVRVESLKSTGNGGTGLLLAGDRRTLVLRPVLLDNGVAGLLANGTAGLQVQDARTSRNQKVGVGLISVQQAILGNLHTGNEAVGVAVTGHSRRVRLDRMVAVADGSAVTSAATTTGLEVVDAALHDMHGPALDLAGSATVVTGGVVERAAAGVLLRGNSAGSRVDGLRVSDVEIGLSATNQVRGLQISGMMVDGAGVGLRISASRVRVTGVRLSKVKTAIELQGGATGVQVDGVMIEGAALGVSASNGTRHVVLRNISLQQEAGIAIASSSAGLRVIGGHITGGQIGLDLHATASVTATTLSGVWDGVRIHRRAQVDLTGIRVRSLGPSLWVSRQGTVRVTGSALLGSPATIGTVELLGHNDLTPGPLPWFGIAGVVAGASAISLELLRRLRETESERHVFMPQHVLNRA